MNIKVVTNNRTPYNATTLPNWIEKGATLPSLKEIFSSTIHLNEELSAHCNQWSSWAHEDRLALSFLMEKRKSKGIFIRNQLVVFADTVENKSHRFFFQQEIKDRRNFFEYKVGEYSCYFGFLGSNQPIEQTLNAVSFSPSVYEKLHSILGAKYDLFIDACRALAHAGEMILHDDLHHLAQFTPTDPQAVYQPFLREFRNTPEVANCHEMWAIQQHKNRASEFQSRTYAVECVKRFHSYFDHIDAMAHVIKQNGNHSEALKLTGMLYGTGLFFLSHLLPLERSNILMEGIADRIDSTEMSVSMVKYNSPHMGASETDPVEHVKRLGALVSTLRSKNSYLSSLPPGYISFNLPLSVEDSYALSIGDHDAFKGNLGIKAALHSNWLHKLTTDSISMLDKRLSVDNQFPVPYPEKAIDEIFEFVSSISEIRKPLLENLESTQVSSEWKQRLKDRYFTLTDINENADAHFECLRASIFAASNGLLEIVHRLKHVPVNTKQRWASYWDMTRLTEGLDIVMDMR